MPARLSRFALLALLGCAGGIDAGVAQPHAPTYRNLGITLPDLDETKTKNDVHVLAFWAVWCPCQTELVELDVLWKDLRGRGLNVYAVSIDGPDTQARVAGAVAAAGHDLPVLLDRETSVFSAYNPKGDCPFYVVLDADGQVIRSKSGYVPGDVDNLRAFLEPRLPR